YRAQPVPPIYQPEVAAEAIAYVADHPRREIKVGWSTVKAILGNRVAPGLLDRYLAHTAYSGQQLEGQPEDPNRPDNLYHPAPSPYRCHGAFDDRSRSSSAQLWLTKNRWS